MQINVEELLGRQEIISDSESIRLQICNKRILITGAAGSIGRQLVRHVISFRPAHVCLVDQSEIGIFKLREAYGHLASVRIELADITDFIQMSAIFKSANPHLIFHAAAYKHVTLIECFPYAAVKNNLFGTKVVADLAYIFQAEKFILISTDKAVKPSCNMGVSKRLSEMYVQSLNKNDKQSTQFIITRFGNVLGSTGSVYPIFKQKIKKKQAITITHPEVSRFFMTLSEASQLVLEAAAMGRGGDIMVFDMGNPVRIVKLAEKMIELAGLVSGKDIEIRFSGLHSGEKLHEELLYGNEVTVPSRHPNIHIARFSNTCFTDIALVMDQCKKAMKTGNMASLTAILNNLQKEMAGETNFYCKSETV